MVDNVGIIEAMKAVGVGYATRPDGSSVLVFPNGQMLVARNVHMLTSHEADRLRYETTHYMVTEASTLSAMSKHITPEQIIHVTKAEVTPVDFPNPGESMDMDWDTGKRRV